MKRIEGEDFEDYRLRRAKARLMQELSLGGWFWNPNSGTRIYARTQYIARKYKKLTEA